MKFKSSQVLEIWITTTPCSVVLEALQFSPVRLRIFRKRFAESRRTTRVVSHFRELCHVATGSWLWHFYPYEVKPPLKTFIHLVDIRELSKVNQTHIPNAAKVVRIPRRLLVCFLFSLRATFYTESMLL